jgi:hypothetical protein
MSDDLPRGIRNNNPGNLIDNEWTRSLPGYIGSDGKFAKYATPHDGITAMDRNLQSYARKGIDTPLGIANRWAPAGDGSNDPNAYAGSIAKTLGIGPNDKIDMSDPATRERLAHGMAIVENGPSATDFFNGKITGTPSAGSPSVGASASAAPLAPGGGTPTNALLASLLGKTPIPFKANDSSVPTPQSKLEALIRAAAGQGTYTPPGIAKLQGLTGSLSQLFGGSTTGPGSPPGPAAPQLASAPSIASPATAAPPPAPDGLASAGAGGTNLPAGDAIPTPPPRPADLGTPVADAGSPGALDLTGALSSLFG